MCKEDAVIFFYNPMWGKMGDNSQGPPGTYYYNDSSYANLFWHTFDQVIMRPDLLEYFSDESLQVLDSIKGVSLVSPDGIPDTSIGSDHLPILVTLQIEQEI